LSESWSEAGTAEECRCDFALWHDDLLEIIAAIDVPYKWALIAREPFKEATAGVVVFSAKGRSSNDTQIIPVCDDAKHINQERAALRNMRGLMIT
jgi:hypothetical protein